MTKKERRKRLVTNWNGIQSRDYQYFRISEHETPNIKTCFLVELEYTK
jgi:hypothetical protein